MTQKPLRVVSHTCSNTEIVCALGMSDCLVGVDDHSDYPAKVVAQLPRIGPDQDIDVDKVRALNPDLVITSLTIPGHEQCVQRLRAARLPLLVLEPRNLADVSRDIHAIANALGTPEAGVRLVDTFEAGLQRSAPLEYRPRILVEWWPKPVIVPGRDSWVTQLVELAGGVNPMGHVAVKSRPVNDDEVVYWQPDAIIISWCGVPADKYRTDVVRRRPRWQRLPAVVNDCIFPISEAWLGRPGPRLIHGLKAMKEIVAQVNRMHAQGN